MAIDRIVRPSIASLGAFARNEDGATAIEYSLMLAVIFLGIVGAMAGVGEGLIQNWGDITNTAVAALEGAG